MNRNETFEALYFAVVEISEKYHVYKTLFRSKESLNILEKYDYGVFAVFQESLANDLKASIFRVLDPYKSCGRENLCFDQLKESFSLSTEIISKISELYEIKEKVKLYRHRKLMHNDLQRILKPEEQEQHLFIWSDISAVVYLSQFIINTISELEFDRSREFIPINVNPDLLLNHLTRLAR